MFAMIMLTPSSLVIVHQPPGVLYPPSGGGSSHSGLGQTVGRHPPVEFIDPMVTGTPLHHREPVLAGTVDVQLRGCFGRTQSVEEFDFRGAGERVIFRHRKKGWGRMGG